MWILFIYYDWLVLNTHYWATLKSFISHYRFPETCWYSASLPFLNIQSLLIAFVCILMYQLVLLELLRLHSHRWSIDLKCLLTGQQDLYVYREQNTVGHLQKILAWVDRYKFPLVIFLCTLHSTMSVHSEKPGYIPSPQQHWQLFGSLRGESNLACLWYTVFYVYIISPKHMAESRIPSCVMQWKCFTVWELLSKRKIWKPGSVFFLKANK